MKVHKAMNVYKGVDAFITPSEFLKKKLIENGFDEKKNYMYSNIYGKQIRSW